MPHLIPDVGKRCARLNQQAPKRVTKVMKTNIPQSRFGEQWLENARGEVVHLDWRTRVRGKDKLFADVWLAVCKGFDQALVTKLQEERV